MWLPPCYVFTDLPPPVIQGDSGISSNPWTLSLWSKWRMVVRLMELVFAQVAHLPVEQRRRNLVSIRWSWFGENCTGADFFPEQGVKEFHLFLLNTPQAIVSWKSMVQASLGKPTARSYHWYKRGGPCSSLMLFDSCCLSLFFWSLLFCVDSGDYLELCVMPKDEDILQLVSLISTLSSVLSFLLVISPPFCSENKRADILATPPAPPTFPSDSASLSRSGSDAEVSAALLSHHCSLSRPFNQAKVAFLSSARCLRNCRTGPDGRLGEEVLFKAIMFVACLSVCQAMFWFGTCLSIHTINCLNCLRALMEWGSVSASAADFLKVWILRSTHDEETHVIAFGICFIRMY